MWIILGILAVIIVYVLFFYNNLKTLQVRIKASIQEIGNQLKRQADLIPNLVESVRGYMKHEKGIFDELTSARKLIDEAVKTNDAKKIDQSQESINKILGSLKIIMESNPEIKASTVVSDLMNELRDTADKTMYARRTLIDITADFNTSIQTIPGIWLAPMFGFKEEIGFEVSESETKTPKVNL